MSTKRKVHLAGTGAFLPGEPIPFDRAQEVLGEIPGAPERIRRWMESMQPVMREILGIEHVHYALDPVTRTFTEDNITMSVKAARKALEAANLAPADIGLICYGSAHQDQMPTASVRIQEALGIEACAELSIHANCTSAYKALYLAHRLLEAGEYDTALVVSSGISSSELMGEYFNPAKLDKESLFLRWFLGDGAGAVVLTTDAGKAREWVVEYTYIESIGGRRPSLMFNDRPAWWMNPRDEYEAGAHHLKQRFRNELATGIFQEEGGSVFFNGLRRMLDKAGIDPGEIRWLQVNLPARHIVEAVLEEVATLGIPREALYAPLDRLGYAGPPMTFIGLDALVRGEAPRPGDRVVSFVTEVSKFMQAGYSIRHE